VSEFTAQSIQEIVPDIHKRHVDLAGIHHHTPEDNSGDATGEETSLHDTKVEMERLHGPLGRREWHLLHNATARANGSAVTRAGR
jgi:hypothetical protein